MLKKVQGLATALILTISAFAQANDPQYKISPVGFLRMLLENRMPTDIKNLDELREGGNSNVGIKVRYLQRGIDTDATDVDDCTTTAVQYKTVDIGTPSFSKIGIFLSFDEMLKYVDAAQAIVPLGQAQIGTAPVSVIAGLYKLILTQINGLIQKIDKNLLAAQATAWGVNVATGNNTAVTINFANTPILTDGYNKILEHAQLNEIADTPIVVGSGVVTQYDILQSLKRGTDNGGFGSLPLNVYTDVNAVGAWGANHFGVFAKGLINFVDYNKYGSVVNGELGDSVFFTMPVPVELSNGQFTNLVFDVQIKIDTCPTEHKGRGWNIIISKNYGLFNAPNDIYKTGDRLAGFNGSLHYIGAIA